MQVSQSSTRSSPRKTRNFFKSSETTISPIIDNDTEIISSSYSEVFDNYSKKYTSTEDNLVTVRKTRHNTSDYSSEEGEGKSINNGESIHRTNLSEHQAYKLYKEAGEYWNKYPKTDYTYSRYSPHRREIAPGVIAMPNMSRRSIHRDDLQNSANHHIEKTLRSRFLQVSGDRARRRLEQMWGRDETDTTVVRETFIQKILRITRITLIYTTIFNYLSSYRKDTMHTPVSRRSHITTVYAERRWYQRIWFWTTSIFGRVLSSFYTLLGYVLLLDCWLLKRTHETERSTTTTTTHSSRSRIRRWLSFGESTEGKHWKLSKKLGFILLIPLLLFIGVYYGMKYDIQNNMPEISIPELSLPPQLFEYAQTSQAALLDTLEYTKLATNNYYNHLYKFVSDQIQYFNAVDSNNTTK